jgi:hypothetical protein
VDNLPTPRTVVQLPDGTHAYVDPSNLPAPTGPQVVHIHQAAPDRTIQRVALGAGAGGGAVAAGVYFGPLLVATLVSMAASLAVVALVVAVSGWAVVTVVRSIGGPDGKAAVQTIEQARKGRRKR